MPGINFGQKITPNIPDVKIESSILLTTEDGLPSNNVRGFAETPDGFIWLGTNLGLSRYDGYQFKNFTHNPEDSTSIYDDRVLPIIADSNHLWIGTHLGFSIMDLKTEKFRNFQFGDFEVKDTLSKKVLTRVHAMDKARNGDIWMGTFTSGIFRYIPSLDSFICYHYPEEEVAPFILSSRINHVLSVKQDRFNDSIIWAGTTAGLLQINAVTHDMKWHLYPKTDEQTFAAQNAIRSIYQHSDSLLYLTSWHAKVNVFNPKTSEFYLLPIENKTAAERAEGYKLLSTPTRPIVPKNEEEIWITSTRGLMAYHIKSKTWKSIKWNKFRQNKIYGIHFIDSNNRVWLPSNDGLLFFDPIQQQFIRYEYDDLNPNHQGFTYYVIAPTPKHDLAILPRSTDGLFFLDVQKNTWEKFSIPKKYRTDNGDFRPRGFSISPSGEWTIVSTQEVYNYHPLKKTFEPLSLPKHLQQKSLNSILWDSSGRLWIGMAYNEGLIQWTPSQNKWKVFKPELERTTPKTDVGTINFLFEDSHKNIWIKRGEGYSVYHNQKDTIYNFVEDLDPERTGNVIHSFTEDKNGRVWLNSSLGLLVQAQAAHPEKGIVKKHDLAITQNIKQLYYLHADDKGMLWGLNGKHIIQIDPNTMAFKQKNLNYGLKNDLIYECQILNDGKIFLGGKNQIWVADTQDFSTNAEQPVPYLTNISVLQEPLKTDTPIHNVSNLDLTYDENFFSFDFSSIGFSKGKSNKFRYRLKGFDDKWTESGKRRFANFTNVPPGDYTFELKAANNEGLWNEQAYSLPVKIARPWWMTIWFWVFFSFLILGIAYWIYQSRIDQIQKEAQIKSEYERKLADVEMSALRAQMNPHFVFNSLNSIDYFIINSEPEVASDYLNRFSRLIRLILQNSKSTIVPLKDDLEALKLYIEMESVRFDNLFDYEVKTETGLNLEQLCVPPMLMQPYVENAIWHGLMQKEDGKGKLELSLHQHNGHIICHIEDNGIGREAALKLKSKSASKRKSYGMKITSDRLEVLNKLADTDASVQIIDLKNEAGEATGTRVELIIPI